MVIILGLVVAALTWPTGAPLPLGFRLPTLPARWPTPGEFAQASLLLALPQIALSLGNSVLATKQVVADLFPDREALSVQRIGTTYALMNLVAAPLGGIPVCHGSGGIAGHYAFGARTGASAVIYGTFLMLSGFLLVGGPAAFQRLFPGPILGTLLLVEAITVLLLVRDLRDTPGWFVFAVGVGLVAALLPYGYAIALAGGTLLSMAVRRWAGRARVS